MSNGKSTPSLCVVRKHLSLNDGTPLPDPRLYRSTIRALQYLTHTRPDITYINNHLSQFLCAPTDQHWQVVKRVLQYISGIKHFDILLQPNSKPWCGGLLWCWLGIECWWPKLHCCLLSLGHQETKCCCTIKYRIGIQGAYRYLNWNNLDSTNADWASIPRSVKPIIWCDNINANALASNLVFHAWTKHIEIDVHFIRDKVLNGQLEVRHIPSSYQVADCLTKPLSHTQFNLLRTKLGLVELPSRLRGDIKEKEESKLQLAMPRCTTLYNQLSKRFQVTNIPEEPVC